MAASTGAASSPAVSLDAKLTALAAIYTAKRAIKRETRRRALVTLRRDLRVRKSKQKTTRPRQMTLGIRSRSHPPRARTTRRRTAALDDGADPPGPSPAAAALLEQFNGWRPDCVTACAERGRFTAPCPFCDRHTARVVEYRDGTAAVFCVAGHSQAAILAELERLAPDVRGAA